MIARIWHGVATADNAEAFLSYMNETGVPDLQALPGNRGVYVLRRADGERVHFLFVSLWESRAAIEQFAGADIEKASYYPRDKEFLIELEPKVLHYDVLVSP